MPKRRRGRNVRSLAWGFGALCIAGAVAGGIVVATGSSGATYRTASVSRASVESLLTLSGTAEPVDRATVSFGASGTVAALDVALGQTVTAGQTLATLAPTSLQQAVTAANTQLTAAQAQLASDEASEYAGTLSSTASQPSATSPTTSGSGGSSTTSAVATDQAAVVTDQQTVDTDQQTATTALATAQTACGVAPTAGTTNPTTAGKHGTGGTGPGSSSTGTTTKGKATSTTALTPSATGTGTPSSGSTTTSAACNAALAAALSSETQVATAEKAETTAEAALAKALAAQAKKASTSTSGSTSTSHGSSTSRGTSASAATITPVQLADDQETIDKDQAAVIEADEALAAANLTTPIAGTVIAMAIAPGDSVSAGSSTEIITVASTGSFEATATLSAAQSVQVKVGDTATVSVVGLAAPVKGSITRVGPVDVAGGDTYPVVVTLPVDVTGVFTGSSATISIDVQQAHDALVVPTPAVHTLRAGTSFVDVLTAGQLVRKTVTVGVVGDLHTQILSGLHTGDTVVLADLTTPVPTSSTTSPFGGVNALSGNTPTFRFNGGTGQGSFSFVRGGPGG